MGFLARLKRVTEGRIEAFLSSVEDPEVVFPQLLREMEGQIRSATEAEAKSMASTKAAKRKVDDGRAKVERLQKGAETAIGKGDEDTARDALKAQIEAEKALGREEKALEAAQSTLDDAREARKRLQAQMDDLRLKKDEIITRARVARQQKKVEETVHGPSKSAKSILDTVAALETKIEEEEAEVEVRREMSSGQEGGPSLDKRLRDLESDADVEERLAALKRKAQGSQENA